MDGFKNALVPYMWYNKRKGRFVVLSSLPPPQSLENVDMLFKGRERVHPAARAKLDSLDYALRFETYQISDVLELYTV